MVPSVFRLFSGSALPVARMTTPSSDAASFSNLSTIVFALGEGQSCNFTPTANGSWRWSPLLPWKVAFLVASSSTTPTVLAPKSIFWCFKQECVAIWVSLNLLEKQGRRCRSKNRFKMRGWTRWRWTRKSKWRRKPLAAARRKSSSANSSFWKRSSG